MDNGIGTYKTDKNLIPKIIELRTVYIYIIHRGYMVESRVYITCIRWTNILPPTSDCLHPH